MARFVTGPELEALVDEYIEHHMLDDPEVKLMVEELDKGIAKLFSEIEEANKELKLREIVPTTNEISTSDTDNAIPSNEPDDIIYIGKVVTDSPVYKQPRPELEKDMKVLAKRKRDDLWYDATVLELLSNQHSQVKVKVKFDAKGSRGIFSCKHIALKNKLKWKDLTVGSRIVAKYENDADVSMKQCLYAGIIAETPLPYNKRKFLVFFDDGFAQYMDCDQIYKVYEASSCVWEDVHEDSREFIKEYLEKYPERPMVRVSEGQFLKTEWKGSWWKTRVLKVQGSLVNMLFLVDERTEWIYRGSPRLEPLHRELMAAEASRQAGKVIRGTSHTVVKRNAPVVEYINVETPTLVNPEERSKQTARKSSKNRKLYRQRLQREEEDRQSEMNKQRTEQDDDLMIVETPRCSFIQSDSTDHKNSHKSNLQQKDDKSIGKRLQSGYDSSGNEAGGDSFKRSKKVSYSSYECHKCSALCVVAVKNQVNDLKDENPLRWPQIVGWQRELSGKRGSGKKTVFYRTPCMKRLRNLEDVCMYLKQTDIKYLAIDNFTFDPFVYTIPRSAGRSCLWGKEAKVIIKDISNGAEMVPIMLVNEIDYERPDESYHYITYRKCKKAIINTDPNFLVCCDCKDNCKDRSKCACQQLTVGATRSSRDGKVDPNAGYKYRRLDEQLPTGIFECNSKCKCSKNCYNRVAQNGVRVRLQVFKTEKRGWGLRCIDDIEAGMFICTYAGNLWNEEEANDFGRKFGDEYFAELDYIDVVEKNKEGYESDVASSEGYESETSDSSCNSDADYRGYRTDSGGSSPYYPPSADDVSVDEGYAATQTKSGTRILLRRKSANNGNQPTKESWSVVDSPEKALKRTNSEPCFSSNSLDSEKKSSDNIIVISSDEDDSSTSVPTKNKDSVPADVKNANLKTIKKEDVPAGDKNNKKDDKPDNHTEIKSEKKQESLTAKEPKLDAEDHQYLEKALTAMFTGHTDDEEALDNIKAIQDDEKIRNENTTAISKVAGINYGYNVNPREVVDNKAIIAYRERRRKKKLKLDDNNKSSRNEDSGKDSPSTNVEDSDSGSSKNTLQSKLQIGVQEYTALKPPVSSEETSNQLVTQTPNSSQPVVETSKSTVSTEMSAAQSTPPIESELSSSDSEDEKASVESGDSTNKMKLRTAKKSTHTRLSLTKSPNYTSQKTSFNISKKDNEESETPSFPRTRSLFGEEHCYVMDAKREGNLGRYFNHGCVPNLFVQNVFVDTHDLRFPWLAFFAGQNIRAGSELTWDYGYEVGSVANKTLYCYCGSVDCRGRLL